MSACICWTCLSILLMFGGWGMSMRSFRLGLRLGEILRIESVLDPLDRLVFGHAGFQPACLDLVLGQVAKLDPHRHGTAGHEPERLRETFRVDRVGDLALAE